MESRRFCLGLALLATLAFSSLAIADERSAEEWFELGDDHFKKGGYEEALRAYRELKRRHPTSELLPYAIYNLGWSYLNLGKFSQSISAFKQIIADFPQLKELAADAQFQVGEAHRQAGEYALALQAYEKVLEEFPQSDFVDEAIFGQAICRYRQKQYDSSKELLRELIERHSFSQLVPEAKIFLATILREMGLHEDSVKVLDAFLEKEEDIIFLNEAFLFKGETFFDLGNFQAAIEVYRKVEPREEILGEIAEKIVALEGKMREKSGEGMMLLGVSWRKLSRYKSLHKRVAAEEDFGLAALYRIGLSFLNLEKYFEARIIFATLLERKPTAGLVQGAHYGIILSYLRQGRLDQAREKYLQFLGEHPGEKMVDDIRFSLGEMFYEEGRYEEAVVEFEQSLKEFPQGRLAEASLYRLAGSFLALNYFVKAREKYADFLSKYAQSQWAPRAKISLAHSYFALGEYESALFVLKNIKKEYAGRDFLDEITYNIGRYYYQLGKYEEASGEFREFLFRFPGSRFRPHVLYGMGDAYLGQVKFEEAIASYRKVVEDYSDHPLAPHAQFQIGRIAHHQGEFQAMAEAYRHLVRKFPRVESAGEALYWIGWNYRRQGQYEEAIREFEQIVAQHGQSKIAPRAQLALGNSFLAKGEYDQALQEYEKMLIKHSRTAYLDDALERISLIYRQSKRYEEGEKRFLQLISQHGQERYLAAELHLARAGLLLKKGDLTQALEIAEKVAEAYSDIKLTSFGYYTLAKCFGRSGDYRRKAEFYKKILSLHPEDPLIEEVKYSLGMVYLDLNKWEESRVFFQELLQAFPGTEFEGKANLGLARCRQGEGRHREAINAFKAIIARWRGELVAEALYRIGDSYLKKGDYREAILYYQRVLILHRHHQDWAVRSSFGAGQAYEYLGEQERAREFYERLIDEFPKSDYVKRAEERLRLLGGDSG